jgi:nitroreductase
MNVFNCIKERHSYRGDFKKNPVPRDDLNKILEAGVLAPSGCNRQTTEFIVIDDPKTLERIRTVVTMSAVLTAPAEILCLVNAERDPKDNYEIEDCAAAVENMLLAITALGYASVWLDGALRSGGRAQQLADILGIPQEKVVRVMLPVGEPVTAPQGPGKLDVEQRVFWNAYK